MIEYEEFCKNFIKNQSEANGGITRLGVKIGIDPSNLSKVIAGTYIPSPKTMMKWFPGLTINTYNFVNVDYGKWQ